MSGSKTGGMKAREANLARDPDFYKKIGAIGGKASKNGGFASTVIGKDGLTGQQRAKLAGAKGGKISKRGKSNKETKAELKRKYNDLLSKWNEKMN